MKQQAAEPHDALLTHEKRERPFHRGRREPRPLRATRRLRRLQAGLAQERLDRAPCAAASASGQRGVAPGQRQPLAAVSSPLLTSSSTSESNTRDRDPQPIARLFARHALDVRLRRMMRVCTSATSAAANSRRGGAREHADRRRARRVAGAGRRVDGGKHRRRRRRPSAAPSAPARFRRARSSTSRDTHATTARAPRFVARRIERSEARDARRGVRRRPSTRHADRARRRRQSSSPASSCATTNRSPRVTTTGASSRMRA